MRERFCRRDIRHTARCALLTERDVLQRVQEASKCVEEVQEASKCVEEVGDTATRRLPRHGVEGWGVGGVRKQFRL